MKLATTLTILALAFIVTVILAPISIPLLRRLKFGQSIREEGPKSHMKKAGTPTMGGIIFLISIVLTTVGVGSFLDLLTTQTVVLLLVLAGFGLIGLLDDGLKVVFKRNLGLTSLQKLIGQIVIAILAYFLLHVGSFDTTLAIPFTNWTVDLGVFYVAFLIFWLVGFSNAVNLTDGLDGLVAGTASIAFAAFGVIALFQSQADIALFAFAVTGALLGFLLFNANPAKVFMGDTGSLALGGFVAGTAYMLQMPLFIIIVGFIYLVEVASVIIQVTYFKKTGGKRIFKMAPIHHHFELCGWSETRVVAVFSIITALLCLIALMGV